MGFPPTMSRVFRGKHEDTGRAMNLRINVNFGQTPATMITAFSQLKENETSLHALANVLPEYYAKPMARILGDQSFRERHEIPASQVFNVAHWWRQYTDEVSFQVLSFKHLIEQYTDEIQPLQFEVMRREQLDPKLSPSDVVHFVRVDDAPYLIGDFNKTSPTGVLEPAVVVELRDLIWLDPDHAIVGPPYDWKDQYICDISVSAEAKSGSRDTLRRILYDQPVEGLAGITLGDVVDYRDRGRPADLQILKAAQVGKKPEVHLAGPRGLVVREGMGALFRMPVEVANISPLLTQIYGRIVGFKRTGDLEGSLIIQIEVYLGKNNLPSWLLSRLNASQQLQTNHRLAISEQYLEGVFLYWPACLLQGTCAPCVREGQAHDKVVVGHLQILRGTKIRPAGEADDGETGSDSELSEGASITSSSFRDLDVKGSEVNKMLKPLVGLFKGENRSEIRAVARLRTNCVLQFFAQQEKIHPQVNQITLHF